MDGISVSFVGAETNTRMTVAKLSDGSLWIHSPIAWNSDVAAFIQHLGGRVSAIIAPNKYHCFWIEQWQERFPQARTFAEPALRKRVKGLANTTALATQPPALYGNEIDQTLCLGNPFFYDLPFHSRNIYPVQLWDTRAKNDQFLHTSANVIELSTRIALATHTQFQ